MTASVTDDIYALRNQGQADVKAADKAVSREFTPYIEAALDRLVASGRFFTVDDIRAEARVLCGRDGRVFAPHPNLFGSVIGTAAAQKRIVRVGEANSARPSRNASRNAVWTAAPTNPAPGPHSGAAAASPAGNPG